MLSRLSSAARAASRMAPAQAGAVRCLNLHEYQSREIMESFNVQVQKGQVAHSVDDARRVAEQIKADNSAAELIVKAQIHAGGRGKGHFDTGYQGGVQICQTVEEAVAAAEAMLGNSLITKQTGPEGQEVNHVLINEGITIDNELYFAILMDRAHNGPVMVASTEGGMNIEDVAEETPEAIVTVPVSIADGIQDEQTALMAEKLGLSGDQAAQAQAQMRGLYDMFLSTDATQVEINPLAVTDEGKVYAVDAKLNFDDSAAYRQQDVFAMRDKSMEDPRDVRAEEAGLNYIGLDGSIGCMVNGAGLAMATLDIIQLEGGTAANFLDVGGGATAEQVTEAFKIITADPNVKGLLVNIFGGIMQCDVIAEGIITAHKEVGLEVPLVVRLEGTNVEQGKALLESSGLPIITADDLDEAARKAVEAIPA